MNHTEILAVVLSAIGTICICIPPLLKGKNMKLILLLVFLTNVMLAISYILTGAANGAASCCVGAVQTIINYFFERKGKPIPKWLIAIYGAAFTLVNLLVFTKAADVLALLATLAFILAICQKNGKQYRLWTLMNTALWLAYDLITLSFGPFSTHVIQITTILVGMVLHDRKKKKSPETDSLP